jgi:Family of unknown function (DUF6174)
MKKNLFLIFIILGFFSCNDKNDEGFITSPIDEDYSSITDPKQRWEAYKLKDYYVDQSWACECVPPNFCNSYIINNIVIDVKYNISKDSYYGRTEEEIYKQTKNVAKTIDEAFDLIKKYKDSAYKTEVEYDKKFGYPTKIFIDIDSLTADEEIIRRFSNLQKIIN